MSTEKEMLQDIKFLAKRSMFAGSCSFMPEREVGVSSNSIVAIAYGISKLRAQRLPLDQWDLAACRVMWRKLPKHRKTKDAIEAMRRAIAAVTKQ